MVRDWFWIVFFVVLDQATKITALLTKPDNWLFQLTWNTGAGFGILQGKNWWLLALSLAVLVLILKPLRDSKGHERIAYLGLAAGIVGNSIDRVVHRAVIDFVSIGNFPVFNIADSLITLSITYLVASTLRESFSSWRFHKTKQAKKK